jgi:hypothetical protein
MRMLRMMCIAGMVFGGLGCNALYFSETEKISLTLEGKADASEPVSGNFGGKSRVVAVVPSKLNGKGKSDSGAGTRSSATTRAVDELSVRDLENRAAEDSLSMLAYFDMKREGKANELFAPITIKTSFITGEAALVYTGGKSTFNAADALKVITGVDKAVVHASIPSVTGLRTRLRTEEPFKSSKAAADLVKEMDTLGAYVPESYDFARYDSGSSTFTRKSGPVAAQGFDRLDEYYGELKGSDENLSRLLSKSPAKVAVDGEELKGQLAIDFLSSELAKVKARKSKLEEQLARDPVYRAALRFYADQLAKQ